MSLLIQIVVDTTNTFSEKWWWFTHRSQSDIPQYEAGYRETRLRGGLLDVTLHTRGTSEPIGDLSSSFPGELGKENRFFWPIEKKCLSRFLEPKTEKKWI